MESGQICLTICVGLAPIAAVAEDSVPAIISDWHEATADTTSVRASVHLIRYDDVSRTRAHANGEFGYRSPGHGFWRLQNDTTDRQTDRVTDAGLPHKTIPFDDAHFRWHADRFFDINDRKKSFSECRIDSGTKSDFRFFTGELLRTVDWATPFLPGRPDKTVAEEWTYSVTHQTKSHMWILAIPKRKVRVHEYWHRASFTFNELQSACWQHDQARLPALIRPFLFTPMYTSNLTHGRNLTCPHTAWSVRLFSRRPRSSVSQQER